MIALSDIGHSIDALTDPLPSLTPGALSISVGGALGTIADHTPGVSNVKGLIEGDKKQALLGAGGAVLDDFGIDANALGVGKTDTSALNADRERNRQLYDQLLKERSDYAATPFERVSGNGIVAPTINDADAQQIRTQQMGALGQLQGAAAGTAPSVALAKYQQNQQDIAAQQQGLAAQAHGTAGVFARREAMRNIAENQRRGAGDAALLQAQEMAQARGQLAGALSDVRGADTSLALERARQEMAARERNALLQQQAEQSNQQAGLQAQSLTNQYKNALAQQGLGASQLAQQGTEAQLGIAQSDAERRAKLTGTVVEGTAGGLTKALVG